MKSADQGNQTAALEDLFVQIPMKNLDAYTDLLP